MIGTTALVAGRSARVARVSTAVASSVASTGTTGAATSTLNSWVGTVTLVEKPTVSDWSSGDGMILQHTTYREMAGLVAVVAAAVSTTVETQGGTIRLDVA